MSKKRWLTVLLMAIYCCCRSQSIEFGAGWYASTHGVFRQGPNVYAGMGCAFGKKFSLALNCNYLQAKNFHWHYDRLIDYGSWNRPLMPPDTFYNVDQTNSYSMMNILLSSRFYGEVYGRSQLFIAPVIGISIMKEKIAYTNMRGDKPEIYSIVGATTGLELGMEYAINKKRNLFLQARASGLVIVSTFFATDIYLPPFAHTSIALLNGRLGLIWKFQH